jgi:hypothetical protein
MASGGAGLLQRLGAPGRGGDGVALVPQPQRRQLQVERILVRHQDPPPAAGRPRRAEVRAHHLEQARWLDRLGQELGELAAPGPQLAEAGDHAGDQQGRQTLAAGLFAQLLEQLHAVGVGQHVVEHDEVGQPLGGGGERRAPIAGLEHEVAVAFQGDPHHLAGDRVVLDHQHRLPAHGELARPWPARTPAMTAGRPRVSIGLVM